MRELMLREAINEALKHEMRRDPRVFLLGEDIIDPWGGSWRTMEGCYTEFGPERVRETPISEEAIVGCAVGAALLGMRPVAEIMFSDFTTRSMDPIVNQAAKMRYMTGGQASVPLVLRTAGGAGRAAAAQHSQSLEAWFTHVPGLKVVMPSTPYDAKGLILAAIRDPDPVIFIEHKMIYTTTGPVPEEDYVVPLGKADVKRQGKDVTVIATSRQVLYALEAAEKIAAEDGVEVEVIDPRTLYPLDVKTIVQSVEKTHRVVVVSEDVRRGGYANLITAKIMEKAFYDLDAPVEEVAACNTPIPFSPAMENFVIPGVPDIMAGIRKVLS
ncbi:MAG: alpha-ketoacid dehydrogenase subunit beta [Dehalococcoidales bacterium]|nr:alpha-ketoacid dehydrogenase subunit beta [Dehalococcoidales bacterium]